MRGPMPRDVAIAAEPQSSHSLSPHISKWVSVGLRSQARRLSNSATRRVSDKLKPNETNS